jgi:hypothetical protein
VCVCVRVSLCACISVHVYFAHLCVYTCVGSGTLCALNKRAHSLSENIASSHICNVMLSNMSLAFFSPLYFQAFELSFLSPPLSLRAPSLFFPTTKRTLKCALLFVCLLRMPWNKLLSMMEHTLYRYSKEDGSDSSAALLSTEPPAKKAKKG